jgi:hypothetical protein
MRPSILLRYRVLPHTRNSSPTPRGAVSTPSSTWRLNDKPFQEITLRCRNSNVTKYVRHPRGIDNSA